jgi:hypothetical protein
MLTPDAGWQGGIPVEWDNDYRHLIVNFLPNLAVIPGPAKIDDMIAIFKRRPLWRGKSKDHREASRNAQEAAGGKFPPFPRHFSCKSRVSRSNHHATKMAPIINKAMVTSPKVTLGSVNNSPREPRLLA